MEILCFNINKPYIFHTTRRPDMELLECSEGNKLTIVLAGQPEMIVNGARVKINVWKVTVGPFKDLTSGIVRSGTNLTPFSTFREAKPCMIS